MREVQWTVFSARCPSRESLARIANKWTAMIVILLHERPRRFSELVDEVDGISNKVLTDTLRALERDGLVMRGDDHAGYALTQLGRTLHGPLVVLQSWAEAHIEEVLDARDRYDQTKDDLLLGPS